MNLTKEKPRIWSDIFPPKIWNFVIADSLSLTSFSGPFWWINFLSPVNLSSELHVISIFCLGSDTPRSFSLYFVQSAIRLESPALKMDIILCRTDICRRKISENVSLMLDNPVPVPFLCELKHIRVYFISNSMEMTCKWLISFYIHI